MASAGEQAAVVPVPSNSETTPTAPRRRPWGLKWRSSVWFVTFVVFLGIFTDMLVYSIIVPVIPFRLQSLGYSGVSGLVGWLLFVYSAALVIATPPVAWFSERFSNRRMPLISGQLALIGAQVMLMLAPTYWLMVLARVAQGISGTVIWVVGLALVCDTAAEAETGKFLGITMMGSSVGFMVGPPVGGALDHRFGFHAPFIFGIIVTAVDLFCRLLIIERKEALVWGVDPAEPRKPLAAASVAVERNYGATAEKPAEAPAPAPAVEAEDGEIEETTRVTEEVTRASSRTSATTGTPSAPKPITVLGLCRTLVKSPRALSTMYLALIYGMAFSADEPALPLYLQAVYGFDVAKVGIIYIAAVVPTIFAPPLAGWLCDKFDTRRVVVACILGALPWYILVSFRGALPYFIVMIALQTFFTAGTVSPITTELAVITRDLEGVGYGHLYGAFNLAYGVGSAIGPIIGGQIYDHVSNGWQALCLIAAGLLVTALIVALLWFGDNTFIAWAEQRLRGRRTEGDVEGQAADGDAHSKRE